MFAQAEQRRVSAERTAKWLDARLGDASPPKAYAAGLVRAIKALPAPRRESVDLLLLGFKAEAQRSARKLFELTKFSSEEVARTLLLFYVLPRGYAEARLGAGQGDIVIPEPRTVIETKIVRVEDDIITGLSQVADYLTAEASPGVHPKGFLVLICTDEVPPYAARYGEEQTIRGWRVPILWLVIPTEAPSRKGKRLAKAARAQRASGGAPVPAHR